MVQVLAKSVKPFRIYRKMKYLTFDFDLGVKVTKSFIFYLSFYGYYMVQFLAKLVKLFRIYCKMKYLTFDFDL